MQQEVLAVFSFQGINYLFILSSAQCSRHESLGFATSKQCGSMCSREYSYFCLYRPYSFQVPAIDTLFGIKNSVTDDIFLYCLKHTLGAFLDVFVIIGEYSHRRLLCGTDFFNTSLLDAFFICIAQTAFRCNANTGTVVLTGRRFR